MLHFQDRIRFPTYISVQVTKFSGSLSTSHIEKTQHMLILVISVISIFTIHNTIHLGTILRSMILFAGIINVAASYL